MAPKRRKLSLDDSEGGIQDAKRVNLETNPMLADTKQLKLFADDERLDDHNEKPFAMKLSSDSSADVKTKEDCPKPVRISERLSIKRNRLGDQEDVDGVGQVTTKAQTPPKKPNTAAKQTNKKDDSKKKTNSKIQKPWGKQKIRRPIAQWSVKDKKLFFLGLGEFGKNFEAICNKISHAARIRGFPVKDKMQVRYFYYRTWAKISKFVHIKDSGVKMKTRELYGLINYGVLKEYVKETDPQFERCLNELIFNGVTTFFSRGKKQRFGKVRTPICTYLKKLNRIEASEIAASNKLPHSVTLELTPKNSKAWGKVQALSQNPRVRLKVTANRTLETVFKYFEKKWKSNRVRHKEGLGGTETQNEELVFFLHPSSKLKPVTLIPQDQPKINVTFKNYREKILPIFLIKKKQRPPKDPEKLTKEKDKPVDEVPVDPGGTENADECSTKAGSNPIPDISSTIKNEPPSPFTCLLAAAAVSDSAGAAVSSSQSSFTEVKSVSTPSSVLLEDENAMFPDDAPFSPPQRPLPPSQSLSSPMMLSSPPPSSVISPLLHCKKKSGKASRRHLPSDDQPLFPTSNCDNPISDSSSSPAKNDAASSVSSQDLKEDSEKEVTRLITLVSEGFTMSNSNNVTLLHLSILLGRESLIKIEYEWRDKNPPKIQLPPLLSQASNQMSNVLRRLCNIATLELSDYIQPSATDQNKFQSKSIPCSHCGRDAASRSQANRRQGGFSERKMREFGTMTDILTNSVDLSLSYPSKPGTKAGGARTYVAAPATGAIPIIVPDPVFRVPTIPNNKPPLSKEEQQKLELERLQAKEIMQQGPNPRRLLKKRTMSRKTSTSVQRSLIPKVDTGGLLTYLQPPISKSMVVRMGPEEMMKSAQAVNIICSAAPIKETTNTELTKGVTSSQDVILLSVKCPEKIIDPPTVSSTNVITNCPILPNLSVNVTLPSAHLTKTSPPKTPGPSLTGQGDISISDFDISLSAAADCTMGPDSGDNFLELVLPKTEQGFSGLLTTPKKKDQTDLDISFSTPILRTPTHSAISLASFHDPIVFPSPLKLVDCTSQQWITSETGDVSLSSILGETSSFKTQSDPVATSSALDSQPTEPVPSTLNYAEFFDNEYSDAHFSSSLMCNKTSQNDLSLCSLLGDPSFKKEDSQPRTSPTLPMTSSSTNLKSMNLFSGTLDVESNSQLFGEGSQDSLAKLDVDGFVNDSSLDFVSKFECLAAQISEKHQQDSGIADKLAITVETTGTES